jgi:hypothetical protein
MYGAYTAYNICGYNKNITFTYSVIQLMTKMKNHKTITKWRPQTGLYIMYTVIPNKYDVRKLRKFALHTFNILALE